VIKGLIWFCAVAKDDELTECCLWLLDAKWKQKRNTEKVMVALGQFGISKEELRARNLIKAPPPAPGPRLIEKMAKAMCLRSENHIQMDPGGELIVVQGQLHFYRLFRSTGRMERVSDNAELELNWPAIPDSIRLFLRRECDSLQQVDFRVHMLMHDSLYGKYLVAK
jgi:hypothetical protein